jgi:hypothetical protein
MLRASASDASREDFPSFRDEPPKHIRFFIVYSQFLVARVAEFTNLFLEKDFTFSSAAIFVAVSVPIPIAGIPLAGGVSVAISFISHNFSLV